MQGYLARIPSVTERQLKTDYEKALQHGQIMVAYARLVMIGPGGVGKTSLLNGLKNIPLPRANSTQLAETSTVRPEWSRAADDPESPWTDVTEDDETDEIVGLVQLVKNVVSGKVKSLRFVAMMEETSGKYDLDAEVKQTVDEILSRAVRGGRTNPKAQAPESEVMLHVWDCGGQPVFLDVLPPFLTSRTMFMLMFDASKNLHEKCVATSYLDGRIIKSEPYRDATTIQLLLQWMATIHATLTKQADPGTNNTIGNRNPNPKAPCILPIGTHGDQLSVQSRKEEILQEISSECKSKAFAYLVQPGVIVDNTKAGEEDPAFKQVRREAYNFVNENLKIPTPITWVLFRKVFKKLAAKQSEPIFTLEQVIKIAQACGVREEEVDSVLKFYHELAVFFHYSHIPSLKKHVIADIQWLINQLAKILALEGFEDTSSLLWIPLRENGILLQSLCEEVWKGSELKPQAFLDLMEDFLLLAPIHSKVHPQHPGKEYFIPSVLKSYSREKDSNVTLTGKRAAPLHLQFNIVYVPPGFFSRLTTLLTKEQKCYVLLKDAVFCDRISILYGEANNRIDKIVISQLPYSIKIEVSREQPRLSHHPLFSTTCREILKLVQECSVTILDWLPGIRVSPAFVCEQCSTSDESHLPHFIKIQPDATTRSSLLCEKFRTAPPSKDQQYWLKVSSNEEGLCDHDLSKVEWNRLVSEIPLDKVNELADCLEMTHHLTSSDHNNLLQVLGRWSIEMKGMDTDLRAHLVHYLRIADLEELAEKLKYGELLDAEVPKSDTPKLLPQLSLTKEDLIQCSRFMDDPANLTLLAPVLNISDDKLDEIRSHYKKPEGQAYQILFTWFSSTAQSSIKREELATALKATNFSTAAKQLMAIDTPVPTVAELMKHVQTANWYQLGIYLGLTDTRLDMIQQDYNKTEDRLTHMFQVWLNGEKEPSWDKIVLTLDDMGLKVLAADIKVKFCET